MTAFGPDDDLRGARFVEADMTGASFRLVQLAGVRIDQSFLPGVTMRGVDLTDADIDGQITGLRLNGVDVVPLVEAELNRRNPGREQAGSDDLVEQRASFDAAVVRWEALIDRTRADGTFEVSVDGEWSAAQTLRHLVFAVDGWLRYGVQGIDDAFWDAGLPFTEYEPEAGALGVDLDATPTPDEVVAAHADRVAQVRAAYDDLAGSDVSLTAPRLPPWAPQGWTRTVWQSMGVAPREHWAHLLFVERDLGVLAARAG